MASSRSLPCTFARGGTSRGAYLLRDDLPTDEELRDQVVLALYGSPDPRQINGLGGGDPLTSKVAVVSVSERLDADVDYTFGQVGVDVGTVFWVGSCGNMSSGVGPFAIEQGLVPATSPVTTVRILNTNTNKVLTASVQVAPDGSVIEDGDVRIAGVPGTGAPILLDFGDCGGSVSGRTLPTGKPQEPVQLSDGSTATVSIVDAATPFVFVSAQDVGMTGTESPAQIDGDLPLLDRLEEIRAYAARAIGLVDQGQVAREVSPSTPRVSVVSAPTDYTATDGTRITADEVSIVGRQLSMQRTHKTYAVTGTLCTGVAGAIPGTVVHELARHRDRFDVGHPGGVISARVSVEAGEDDVKVLEASLVRTARRIMTGTASIPATVWPPS